MHLFDIIIPLFNSQNLNIQLKSIFNLDLQTSKINLIFVDDWSLKSTKEKYLRLFKKFQDKFQDKLDIIKINFYELKWEKKWINRVSHARNLWYQKSISQNLIFIDQETILPYDYIQNLINLKIHETSVCLWVYFWYNNEKKSLNKKEIINYIFKWKLHNENIFKDFRINFYQKKINENRIWEFFLWSNFFIKKNFFEMCWWFDEKIFSKWENWDVEFGFRLFKKKVNINFCDKRNVLNISKKLYKPPFRFFELDKTSQLSDSFCWYYEKHNFDIDYKKYILDRFWNEQLDYKKQFSNQFQKTFLNHNFYSNFKKSIFIRIDDINDENIDRLWFLQLFNKIKLPFVLWVEPGNCTKKLVGILKTFKEENPQIDIVQHWFKHINHSNIKKKYEFWDTRSFEQQFDDIKNWFELMKKHFWNLFFEWFIPPFNFYNLDTQKILDKLWFKLISSWNNNEWFVLNSNIISLDSNIDIVENYKTKTFKDWNFFLSEFQFFMQRDWIVWILLHPQFLEKNVLLNLISFLIENKKIYNFINFSQFNNNYKI